MVDQKQEINNIFENIQTNQESLSLSLNEALLSEPLTLDNKLAQLCLKLPKIEFNELDIDDVYILWLGNESENESINGIDIKMFSTNDGLINFISEIQTKNIFLIIGQYFASNILSFLDDFSQIVFIYILTNDDELLFFDCKKPIRQITNNKTELFRLIEEDINLCRKDYISTSIFDLQTEEESSTNQTKNLSYLWYHLLINSLFDLTTCQQTSKSDFIKYCREEYLHDRVQQNLVTEFETNYSSTDAIRWYTRNSFLYRLLNKAIRTRDIDLIFKFRFFIIDFQNQLEQYYNEELMELLYRSQQLSSLELNKLINSKGKYISINTYLSATADRTVVERFADDPSSVVFVINTENAIHRKNPRARPVSIQDRSYFPDEYEVIFPIGSTFLVESVEMINNQWHFNLKLSDDDNYEQLFTFFQNNYIIRLPSTVKFADLLVSTGDYEKAEQYLKTLIEDLPLSQKAYAYDYMGQLYCERNEYNHALSCFQKALDSLPIDDIYSARIYIHIGSLYYQKNEYDQALEYYNKALHYEQEIDYWDLMELYDKFGVTFSQMNRFEDALLYLNRALDLHQSNQLSYHGYFSTYVSLVVLYAAKSEFKEALRLLKKGLYVMLKIVPKSHPEFVFIYAYLGQLSCRCEDYTSAMTYCQIALQLKDQIWKKEILIPFCYIFLCNTFVELYNHNNDRINQFYYAQEALNTYKKFIHNIPQTSPIVPILYINMGTSYYLLRETSSAFDCFLEALKFIDDIGNRMVVYVNLAMIFIDQGDMKMALNYLHQSSELISNTKHSIFQSNILVQLNYEYSRVYHLENNLEKSIFHAETALQFNENPNYHLIFNIYIQLSKLCPEKEHLYIKKLLHIIHEPTLPDNIQKLYRNYIGLYFKRQKNYFYALDQFQCLLKYQLANKPPCYYDLILTYSYLSEIYLKIEPKEFNQILFYSNKCFDIYSQLLTMKDLPIKDRNRMFYIEKYLLDNIKQSSLVTCTLFLLSYSIANYFITEGNTNKGLDYIEKAKQILNQYQGSEERLDRGFRYYVLASAYRSIQYYNQAIFYYKKSVACLSNDYNQYGWRYASLAQVYRDKKDYQTSISTYKIALTFLHNSQEMNYEYLSSTYRSAALLYFSMNNYDYTFVYSQQAIEYFLLCNPIDYNALISMYTFSALSCWKSRSWICKQPLEYLLSAIGYRQYDLTNDVLRDLYSTIGFFYMLNEMYDKAILYYNKVFEYCISSDQFSSNYEKLWLTYTFMGDWNQAYDIIKKSIEHQFNEKILNYNHISGSYMDMGNTYYRFGKYELALKCYQTAYYLLQAFQNDPTHGKYGEIYNYIGLIYFKYGNLADALKYCLKSRDILSLEKNQDFLPIYPFITLGMIECKLGNYSNSLNYLGEAWELIYNNNRYYNLAHKTLYNHIGYVYYKLGQRELAMKFYLKSLSLHNEYHQHPDLAQVHKNIGLIYQDDPKNYSLALSSYKLALELVPTNEHPDYIFYQSMIIRIKKKIKEKRRKKRLKRICRLL
jgi:tetratricopeptide (TPR) repeat protein